MSDYRELKRLAERAIPDVEWFKANNLSCHSNVDSSAAAFIAKATPAAVLALLAENERLVASLSKPDDITAEPAADYDALRKQFMALRSLANSNSRMVSHWRNRCGIETRETLLANADNVNAERDTNQMLTKALLAAEDERDQLKAENEALRNGSGKAADALAAARKALMVARPRTATHMELMTAALYAIDAAINQGEQS